METLLAVVASVFAIAQGSVWVVGGVTRYRKSRRQQLPPLNSYGTVAGEVEYHAPAVTHLSTVVIPELVAQPPLAAKADGRPQLDANSPEMMHAVAQQQMQFRIATSSNSFIRILETIWHIVFVAFLPVLGIAAGMGLGVLAILPFRKWLADPGLIESSSTLTNISMALILSIPSVMALRRSPNSGVHFWMRRISIGLAIFIFLFIVLMSWFFEPS